MPYDIQLLNGEGFIKVVHAGEVNLEEKHRARRDAAILSDTTGINKILVDNRDVLSSFRMLEHLLFNSTHHNILPTNIKIGILFSKGSFNYNEYIEQVANTISGTNLKVFIDETATKEWLFEDD